MREIPCEPLDSISGSGLHSSLAKATERLRRSSKISLVIALIFLIPITIAIIPFLVFWAGWVAYTTAAFFSSLAGLLSAEARAAEGLPAFVIMSAVSFAVDLLGAIIVVFYFIFAIWAWNSFRMIAFEGQNVALSAIFAENAGEVRKATTTGIFGIFYGVFESSLGRILSLGGMNPAALLSSIYPEGALVLVTPGSRWPLSEMLVRRKGFGLITRDEGPHFVLACMQNGMALAIGVFRKEHRRDVLAVLGRTNTD